MRDYKKAKTHLSSVYGTTACRDINRDWFPEHDRPPINSWYPCRQGDDYLKIVIQERRTPERPTTYRVVSMRGADVGFDLTLSMARCLLMSNTRKR